MKTILDYAELVKEQHALNTIIAPVEADLTSASKAYAVGQKFIHDGVLYQAKTAIAQGAALVLNTNYEAADDVSSEIQTLTNKLDDEVETRAKLGAHQFLNYNLATLKTLNTTGTWSDNVYTLTDGTNTITVTVNSDLSITVNGTPPVNAALQFNLMDKAGAIPIGSYGLNGCPSGGTYGTYGLYANSSGSIINTDYGNGGSIDYAVSTNALKVFIIIRANVTVNNLLFKPLIRLASDPSIEFTSYAMTNRELTDIKSIPITLNSDYFDNNSTAQCFKLGRLVWLQVSGTTIAQIPSGNIYLTTSSNIPNAKVGAGIVGFAWNPTSGILGQLRISSNAINFPFNTAIPSGTQFKITLMYMTED